MPSTRLPVGIYFRSLKRENCPELTWRTTTTGDMNLEASTVTTVSLLHGMQGILPPRHGLRDIATGTCQWWPSQDLVRQGGRITDSGAILVSRPVPFKLVKEACLLVPSSRDHRSFELIEKIYVKSWKTNSSWTTIRHRSSVNSGKERKPATIMNMLCDMPEGPHTAGKERLLRALAQAVSYHHEDTRRHRYMKEGIIFLIKNTRPDVIRMGGDRRQPWDANAPLPCLLSCGSCVYIKVHNLLVTIHFMWEVPKECTAEGDSFGGPCCERCTNHGGSSSSSSSHH